MKGPALLAALLSPILSCLAAPLSDPSQDNKVVRLPIKRQYEASNIETPSRRDVPVSLTNYKAGYAVDLTIGTPPQNIQLTLDTGSSEIWAFGSTGCNQCLGNTYNPLLSKTAYAASDLGPFSQAYGDLSSASGYYVTDKVTLGTASITDVYLGVATRTDKFQYSRGVMGIGYDSAHTSSKQYPGILQKMYNQKIISSRTYSIYLDDLASSTGSIIFGGIDKTKYTGNLVTLPIIPKVPGDSVPRLQVSWTLLSITNSTGASVKLTAPTLSYPVLLDTGATLTALPPTIYWALYTYFGASTSNGVAYVNCNMPKGYLTFGFGTGPAVTINVPFSELSVPTSTGKCWFGLRPLAGPVMAMGDTFLRSAYVHFDFEKDQIGLAQSKV